MEECEDELNSTNEEEGEGSIVPLDELVDLAGSSVKRRPERKIPMIIDTTTNNVIAQDFLLDSFNEPLQVEAIPQCESPSIDDEIGQHEVLVEEADLFLRSIGLNSSCDRPVPSLEPEEAAAEDKAPEEKAPEKDRPSRPAERCSIIPDMNTWKREEIKAKRMKGQSYVGYTRKDKSSNHIMLHNAPKAARAMGPVCSLSSMCSKRANRHCHDIEQRHRIDLFEKFWQDMDWGEKKMFICSLVSGNDPKRKASGNTEGNSRKPKGVTYSYFLLIEQKKIQVCQQTFLNTFGLKYSTVRHWLADYWGTSQQSSESPAPLENNNEVPSTLSSYAQNLSVRKDVLDDFLNVLPKLPSHYCRASSSRLYFQSDITSWAQLYQLYKDRCAEKSVLPLSGSLFRKRCKEMKLSIFHPKKDQCDVCTAFKYHNVAKDKYEKHILLKQQARDAKKEDKTLAEAGEAHVLCCDVMAVKLIPCIETSVAYYKMKLAMHNYTIYNLGNHDAINYWLTENECTLVSSVFATCMVEEINRLIDHKTMDVVIYSDGCGYQNRNTALANALLSVSINTKVTITQKFLERGHTQMEGDSCHSVIETAIKKKDGIYLPHEMVQLTKEARKFPMPYRAKMMSHDQFYNYAAENKIKYTSIRPGNKPHEPVVTDIRCLKYTPEGVIYFKLRYDEDFRALPRRPKNVELKNFPRLFDNQLPIPKDKFDDLQSLKMFMPKDCHHFFDSLRHEEESYKKTVGLQKKQEKKRSRAMSPSTPGPSGLKKPKKSVRKE